MNQLCSVLLRACLCLRLLITFLLLLFVPSPAWACTLQSHVSIQRWNESPVANMAIGAVEIFSSATKITTTTATTAITISTTPPPPQAVLDLCPPCVSCGVMVCVYVCVCVLPSAPFACRGFALGAFAWCVCVCGGGGGGGGRIHCSRAPTVFSSAVQPRAQRESNRRLHGTSPVIQPLG